MANKNDVSLSVLGKAVLGKWILGKEKLSENEMNNGEYEEKGGDVRLKIKYINENGDSVFLGDNKPFVYLFHSGLDTMSASPILSKAPYQIGKTAFGNNINERSITITFAVIAESEEQSEIYRRKIIKTFSPLFSGTLEIIGNSFERAAYDCLITSTPKFKDDNYKLDMQYIMECQVSMIVPEAFLSDIKETFFTLTRVIPLFEFPFECEIGEQFEMGTLSFGGITYNNEGDCESPIIVEIKGPVKTPKLINATTNEFIKVNIPVLSGQKLIINTSFTNKYVKLIKEDGSEENAFHYIDLESSFFKLKPGENHIDFWAEEGNDTANVDIYFKRRWTGI